MSTSAGPVDVSSLLAQTANGHGSDNKGPMLLRMIWIFITISTIFVGLRLFVKIRTTRRLFWDDYLIVLSLLLGILHSIFVTDAIRTGLGRHLLTLYLAKPGDRLSLPETMRHGIMTFAPGFLSPMAGRLSFMVFLVWVTDTDARIRRWPIYVFVVVQIVFNVISVVLFYAQCGVHLSVYWSISSMANAPGICWNPLIQTYWGYVAGSFNSATDLFLTVYPAIIVSYSKLTMRSRIGLLSLLCLSCLAMVAAIEKTVESKVLSEWTDFTYNLIPYVIWMAVEYNVVIVVSSVPILRPLFKRNGLSRVVHRNVTDVPNHHHYPGSSSVDKSRMRTRTSSMSSEEKILPSRSQMDFTITRTIEVSVSHSPRDRAFVHAALIGLPTERI